MMSEIMEQYNREAVDEEKANRIKKMFRMGYSLEQVESLYDEVPQKLIKEIYASANGK